MKIVDGVEISQEFDLEDIECFLNELLSQGYFCSSCGGNQIIHIHKKEFLKKLLKFKQKQEECI